MAEPYRLLSQSLSIYSDNYPYLFIALLDLEMYSLNMNIKYVNIYKNIITFLNWNFLKIYQEK